MIQMNGGWAAACAAVLVLTSPGWSPAARNDSPLTLTVVATHENMPSLFMMETIRSTLTRWLGQLPGIAAMETRSIAARPSFA